jgi:hypothetical protein
VAAEPGVGGWTKEKVGGIKHTDSAAQSRLTICQPPLERSHELLFADILHRQFRRFVVRQSSELVKVMLVGWRLVIEAGEHVFSRQRNPFQEREEKRRRAIASHSDFVETMADRGEVTAGRAMLDAYCCSGGGCGSRDRQALSAWVAQGMLYQTSSSQWVARGDARFRITISTRVALKDVGVFSALDLHREAGKQDKGRRKSNDDDQG